jgi:predicted Zn-dependent protease
MIHNRSQLCRGYTRDGLWLIENGKISKAIKNMAFTESPLFVLNNVEQLGVAQRIFHPSENRIVLPQPIIVPTLKVKEFCFSALTDAV